MVVNIIIHHLLVQVVQVDQVVAVVADLRVVLLAELLLQHKVLLEPLDRPIAVADHLAVVAVARVPLELQVELVQPLVMVAMD